MSKKVLVSLVVATSCLVLSGCYTDVTIPVKYSDVFSTKTKNIHAKLTVHSVPSCSKENIDKAFNIIHRIFPHAQYNNCGNYTDGPTHYLEFKIPVQVGGIGVKDCTNDQLCVAQSQDGKNVNVFVGKAIRDKLNFLSEVNENFKLDNLALGVQVCNSKEVHAIFPSGTISNFDGDIIPVHFKEIVLAPNFVNTYYLSDTGKWQAISRGISTVLHFFSHKMLNNRIPVTEQKFDVEDFRY